MPESKAVAKKEDSTIRGFLQQPNVQAQFMTALPKHITPERFLRVATTTIMQNEMLLKCDRASLMKALVQCAQLGLEPDGILGHAYLIPYRNNKKGITEAQFQVGFKGLISLARRSGEVGSFQAQVVYENDLFEFNFGDNSLTHSYDLGADRGKNIGAYAIVTFKDGSQQFDVMGEGDINKVKGRSKAKDSGPWKTDTAEMWRKTVAKRLAKYLPLSVEFQKAASLDESNDMGLGAIDVTAPTTDELSQRLEGKTEVQIPVEELTEDTPPDREEAKEPGKKKANGDPVGCTQDPETCRPASIDNKGDGVKPYCTAIEGEPMCMYA